jgi:hypothetical protein
MCALVMAMESFEGRCVWRQGVWGQGFGMGEVGEWGGVCAGGVQNNARSAACSGSSACLIAFACLTFVVLDRTWHGSVLRSNDRVPSVGVRVARPADQDNA